MQITNSIHDLSSARHAPAATAASEDAAAPARPAVGRRLGDIFRNALGAARRGLPLPLRDVVPASDAKALQGSGRNGLWVTVELAPFAVAGGLGQVSETGPEVLNQYLGKDVRIMMPHLRGLQSSGLPFERTGIRTTLPGFDGQAETFELLQCVRPGRPVLYSIENQKYFGAHDLLYTPKENVHPTLGEDALFKSVMMYNRAAQAFIPALGGAVAPPADKPAVDEPAPERARLRDLFARVAARLMPSLRGSAEAPAATTASGEQPTTDRLLRFDGPLEFLISHDWLTSPLFNELDAQTADGLGRIFFLHNTYDEVRDLDTACRVNHLRAPQGASIYSPLRIGLEKADAVIGNAFYVDRLVGGLAGDSPFVPALRAQVQAGHVHDMHHGLSDTYSPRDNARLRESGYADLPKTFGADPLRDLPALAAFKAHNRAAVQREMGLREDPQAVIFSWIARPEPYQKGFTMLMDQLGDLLACNPRAQAVVAGIHPEKAPPDVRAWMDGLRRDPALQGRVSFPGFVDNQKVVRLASGSSFLVLPSLYEPYGLSQLEAMRVGATPIVHPVDGLRATVSDPEKGLAVPAALAPYGRTGVFMAPLDVPAFWDAMDARVKGAAPDATRQRVLEGASASLRAAMDEALALETHRPDEALQVRYNGMRYVEEQHGWKPIAARYAPPIDAALQAARARAAAAPGAKVSVTA